MVYNCHDFDFICEGVGRLTQENLLENTELVETESILEVDSNVEILTQIYNDVHIIMVLTILTFCMSCLRGWRKNVVKGVR